MKDIITIQKRENEIETKHQCKRCMHIYAHIYVYVLHGA